MRFHNLKYIEKVADNIGSLTADNQHAENIEDVKALRSIGRKSINEFSQEDIEKSQKWVYKFYKQLCTKSPFFLLVTKKVVHN